MNHIPHTRKNLPLTWVAFAATLAFGLPAHAQLYWDTNGTTLGAGVTADGTWDTGTTSNWTTDATGENAATTYVAASDVTFSAGSDVATATITASGTPSAHSITIEEGVYSFSGNISLSSTANTGSLNIANGASASFAGNITLLGNTAFAIEGSLSTNIIGAGKTLTKTGAGTLTLSDAATNDYTIAANGGLIILQRSTGKQLKASSINDGGTVRIAANEQFGANLSVNTGGTLEIDAGISDNVVALSGGGDIIGGSGSGLGATSGTFSGSISGDVALTKLGTGTFTLSGANTSTGNTTVNVGTFTLSSTGSMTFEIGANGVNNAVLGAGTDTATNFAGTFNFDLSGADLTNGNSWLIVDVDNLNQSFASSFAITGFSQNPDEVTWTNGAGLTFSEVSGILSYSVIPEPSSYALFAGAGLLGFAAVRRKIRGSLAA